LLTKQTLRESKLTDNVLTRRDFLRLASAVTLSAASLGASGCRSSRGEPAAMNVVVVVLDSLRKDHLGAYGNNQVMTPNLDSLARESLLFTNAYPESIPTICARRAIHTGTRTFPFKDRPSRQKKAMVYGWLHRSLRANQRSPRYSRPKATRRRWSPTLTTSSR
jgi:hypothetical protein